MEAVFKNVGFETKFDFHWQVYTQCPLSKVWVFSMLTGEAIWDNPAEIKSELDKLAPLMGCRHWALWWEINRRQAMKLDLLFLDVHLKTIKFLAGFQMVIWSVWNNRDEMIMKFGIILEDYLQWRKFATYFDVMEYCLKLPKEWKYSHMSWHNG